MSAFEVRLPPLREDLQLLAGPAALDGSPTWTIHDPARNRYFRIGRPAFQMLSRWSLGTLQALIAVVHSTTTCRLSNDDVLAFIKFLYANSLTVGPPGDKVSAHLEQYLAG